MATTKIRGNTQIIAGTITNAEISASANIATSKLAEGAEFLKRDGSVALIGNLDANSNKIVNLALPTNPNDAANKFYVDSVASGLDVKQSARVATTGSNISLSGLSTIDGITLIAGDRVLVKDQTAGADNGIYVAASGAWSRASDANEDAEVTSGLFTFIEEGSANGGMGFVLTTPNPIVVGTTSLSFSQFTGLGNIIAGAGLTKTGNTLNVNSANAAIAINADDIELTLADASLEITGSGLRITSGTAGQVLVANASGIPLAQTLSGDVASVSATGVVSLNAANIVKKADVIIRETPSGTIDGSNDAFSLANTPVVGSEEVYLNGLLQEPGALNDYTISGASITFNAAPLAGDRLKVSYLK
jgi:hypothetical protein